MFHALKTDVIGSVRGRELVTGKLSAWARFSA
jgi:hypothetical protein